MRCLRVGERERERVLNNKCEEREVDNENWLIEQSDARNARKRSVAGGGKNASSSIRG